MGQNSFTYYQEITLLPSQEINLNFLMSKVFKSLHLLFVNHQINGVVKWGISFPGYDLDKKTLGNRIRLFYDSFDSSEELNIKEYLNIYNDYIHITNIRNIPNNVKFAIFKRVQKKGSKYKLARRYSKRNNISFEDALDLYKDYDQLINTLPFVNLISLSNKNKYNIYIEKIESEEKGSSFTTFGLGLNSTVPIF